MTILDTTVPLRGRTEAEAHVGMTCFKLGPPRLIGAELEFLVHHRGDRHVRPALGEIAAALGEYAPAAISPLSPARPLPGGSLVSIEPGGQVELSSSPFPDSRSLCEALARDAETLGDRLAGRDLRALSVPADEIRPPRRLLHSPRYDAMETALDRHGVFGRLMMADTAATQVSVDAGAAGTQFRARWALLHEAAPALVAAFACSPRLAGAPPGRWASQRMRTWLKLDPARTRGPSIDTQDPVGDYARWALDVPPLCVRHDDAPWAAPVPGSFADWVDGHLDGELPARPTTADLDYHLSTLFPPVRARGHLEVRYLDAQPGTGWQVPIAVLDVLLADDAALDAARDAVQETRTRLRDAARLGLADPALRRAAGALLALAASHIADPLLAQRVSEFIGSSAGGR